MNRKSMVPFSELVRLCMNTDHIHDTDTMEQLEYAYEQGMIQMLKEIAKTELLHYEEHNDNQCIDKDAEIEASNALDIAMNLCMNQEQTHAVLEVESSFNHRTNLIADKYFIDGFLLGYQFLKRLENG